MSLTVTVSLTPFETAVPLSPKAIRSVNVDTFKQFGLQIFWKKTYECILTL